MTILEAIQERHSVRHYLDKPLADEVISVLTEEIAICNAESGLHIQLVTNEPKAFGGFVSHYGFFKGVTSYFAMIGPKGPDLEEKCGYYGEQLVLKAQQLGLNTCWVAATYSKVPEAFEIGQDEKLVVIIALGYGKTQGSAHKSKAAEAVSNISSFSSV